jgi:F0F1-type ATP synthase membrane subunit b/b'
MFGKIFGSVLIASVMVSGIATNLHAQEDEANKAKQDAKQAGKDAGSAGKQAGEAGKNAGKAAGHAGKATGEAAKKGAKKTGQVTSDAAKETAEGTKKAVIPDTTSAACNDGTVQTGKTKTTACADHGGVKN